MLSLPQKYVGCQVFLAIFRETEQFGYQMSTSNCVPLKCRSDFGRDSICKIL